MLSNWTLYFQYNNKKIIMFDVQARVRGIRKYLLTRCKDKHL